MWDNMGTNTLNRGTRQGSMGDSKFLCLEYDGRSDLEAVVRNFAPSADRTCSSGLNGLDLEQIVHNKVGRLLLETTDTWNAIFDGMMWLFTYGEISPRKYLHKHIKHKRSKVPEHHL